MAGSLAATVAVELIAQSHDMVPGSAVGDLVQSCRCGVSTDLPHIIRLVLFHKRPPFAVHNMGITTSPS